MKSAFYIHTNSIFGTREGLTSFFDEIPEISYWYACMPNAVFFISTLNAEEITDKILQKFGKKKGMRFVIMKITNNYNGWMPKEVWHLIKNPEAPRLPKSA